MTMKAKQTISLQEKLRARLRKEIPVSKERKVTWKLENLAAEAQALHIEGKDIRAHVETITSRVATTLPPSSPPPNREPLFRADGQTAPPSQYEAELKAYNNLLQDWQVHQKDIKNFGKRVDRFAIALKTLKKRYGSSGSGKAFCDTDHQLESSGNALHNLQEQRGDIETAVAKIRLPVEKTRR
ncbi:uncharacterized protein RCC_00664 [Ramularia collo-cygni]|uniref:Uncharacterized protein n=1 Tax=Ramularia collo-cygni TaxID=112498 RepID=A0A2D3ULE6_9PEZI|nr:uncharacterized protein RCC_00664 [Ramularia collo-cygni]CZT14692.1 uncharacterized protein RCC_00664 [Ramularia collo-cygni]